MACGGYGDGGTMVCGDGDDSGGGNDDVLVGGARSGGGGSGTDACGGSGSDSGWTPSPTFCEQPLEKEETPFFSQMTAKVCWGGGEVPSPLIEPKMGREGKEPLEAHDPKA